MTSTQLWQERIGHQRDWIWRGWAIRYSVILPAQPAAKAALILLHGFGAAIEHWRHNIPELSQERAVYTFDLLGFGGSRKANTEYSTYLWADQIYDFWRLFINQPVILVGNSIGSLVCLTAALQYPDMVAGIVMLSLPDISIRQEAIPARLQPVVTRIENLFAASWLLKALFRVVRRPQVIKNWVGIAYENKDTVDDELVQIICQPPLDQGADQAFVCLFESVRQTRFAPPAKQVLPLLTIPILLIWGAQDRMVPPLLADRFAVLNPRITFEKWEGVGHCPQDECGDRFNQTLLRWLAVNFEASQVQERITIPSN